jgi:hypothetical protein
VLCGSVGLCRPKHEPGGWLEIIDSPVNREALGGLKVATAMDAANQRDEMLETYGIPGGAEGTTRILSPAEAVQALRDSVPQGPEEESTLGPEEQVWLNPPLPLSLPFPPPQGSGAYTSSTTG